MGISSTQVTGVTLSLLSIKELGEGVAETMMLRSLRVERIEFHKFTRYCMVLGGWVKVREGKTYDRSRDSYSFQCRLIANTDSADPVFF